MPKYIISFHDIKACLTLPSAIKEDKHLVFMGCAGRRGSSEWLMCPEEAISYTQPFSECLQPATTFPSCNTAANPNSSALPRECPDTKMQCPPLWHWGRASKDIPVAGNTAKKFFFFPIFNFLPPRKPDVVSFSWDTVNLRGCSASHGALWTGAYSNVQAWHYNQGNVPKPEMLRRWGGGGRQKGDPTLFFPLFYGQGKSGAIASASSSAGTGCPFLTCEGKRRPCVYLT